jgi:hypothetical protein
VFPPLLAPRVAGDNEKALLPHVHLQEKGMKIARTLLSAWLCKTNCLMRIRLYCLLQQLFHFL